MAFRSRKDDCANGVEKSACDEQGHGSHAKLVVDGADEEDDDPAHEQEADVRHQHRNFGKENGFDGDEENRQTPDDAEQHPACGSAKDGEAEGCVCACNKNVDGVVVENAEDAQIFIEKQKEMQEAAK